mmetsp:Transcript_3396/g.6191  ORF Transcript_3396/g.6191 Transcript_3396/m.6191 type:complete len:200 (-) Transcript_3396:1485-2084(-)
MKWQDWNHHHYLHLHLHPCIMIHHKVVVRTIILLLRQPLYLSLHRRPVAFHLHHHPLLRRNNSSNNNNNKCRLVAARLAVDKRRNEVPRPRWPNMRLTWCMTIGSMKHWQTHGISNKRKWTSRNKGPSSMPNWTNGIMMMVTIMMDHRHGKTTLPARNLGIPTVIQSHPMATTKTSMPSLSISTRMEKRRNFCMTSKMK